MMSTQVNVKKDGKFYIHVAISLLLMLGFG